VLEPHHPRKNQKFFAELFYKKATSYFLNKESNMLSPFRPDVLATKRILAPGPFPTDGAWEKLNPIPEASGGATQSADVPLRRFGEMHELQTIGIDGGHHLAAPSTFAALANLTDEQWARAKAAVKASTAKEKAQRTVSE